MSTTRLWAFAALLALFALCCAARPAMEFASDGIAWWDDDMVDKNIAMLHNLGVTHVRHDYWMHYFDPCSDKAAYAHQQYQKLVQKLLAQNPPIQVQMVISGIAYKDGIPVSLHGDQCPGKSPSGLNPSPSVFAQFVYNELPLIYSWGVRRISLWNEPNLKFFLSGSPVSGSDQTVANHASSALAKKYYQLYKAGLSAIRTLQKSGKVGKDLQILFGEISAPNNGIGFIDMVLSNGKLKADGLAIHPYQFCTPPDSKAKPPKSLPAQPAGWPDSVDPSARWYCTRWTPGGLAWVPDWKKAIARWAKSKKLTTFSGKPLPLYLTEFGLLRSPYSSSVAEATRVEWYPRAMEFARKQGVKQMLVFQINADNNHDVWDSGIVSPDGVTPLPSYYALKSWASNAGYSTH